MLPRMRGVEELEARRLLASDLLLSDVVVHDISMKPRSLDAGDLNGDQILDLIAVGDKTEILLGKADGTYERAQTSEVSGHHVSVADFDGDGDSDVGVVSTDSGLFRVLLNDGMAGDRWSGLKTPSEITLGGHPQGLVLGDFDGDGDVDVATGTGGEILNVLLNQGVTDGAWLGFEAPVSYPTNSSHSSRLAVGDVDSDGDLDLAVGTYFGGDVTVLLGHGDGSFADGNPSHVAHRAGTVQLGDLDGDKTIDAAVVVIHEGAVTVAVMMGDGTGKFGEPTYLSIEEDVDHVQMGDLDSDGDQDLAAVGDDENGGNLLHLLINQGDGSFREHDEAFACGGTPVGLTIAELDSKGSFDLAVVNRRPNSVAVFANLTEPPVSQVPGDSTQDGVFDRWDIVHVMQAAKYETGEPADWSEGDWDGNGVFDRMDIVHVLATGQYQA